MDQGYGPKSLASLAGKWAARKVSEFSGKSIKVRSKNLRKNNDDNTSSLDIQSGSQFLKHLQLSRAHNMYSKCGLNADENYGTLGSLI